MKKAALLFLLATAATACSKSSDSQDPAAEKLYPAKVVCVNEGATTTTIFNYDTQNRLTEALIAHVYDGNTTNETQTYTYTNDLLSEMNSVQTQGTMSTTYRLSLGYTNGKLTTVQHFDGDLTEPSSTDTLYYSNGSLPNIITQNNGFESNHITYDAKGNATAISYSNKQNTTCETTITYDTDHPYYTWCIPNPNSLMEQYKYCPLQKQRVWKFNGQTTGTYTTTYTYTFNAQGYPTTVTTTYYDGVSYQTPITYDITYK